MDPLLLTILTRAAGVLGIACIVIAFQFKKHKYVMLFKSGNEIFFALQYLLLGAYTGCAMNLLGTTRNLIFAKEVEKGISTRLTQVIYGIIFIVVGIFTWGGPLSILTICAKLTTTISFGIKNTRVIRLLSYPVSTCWIIYNASCASYEGVICEIFSIASVTAAVLRYDLIPYIMRKKLAKAERERQEREKQERAGHPEN